MSPTSQHDSNLINIFPDLHLLLWHQQNTPISNCRTALEHSPRHTVTRNEDSTSFISRGCSTVWNKRLLLVSSSSSGREHPELSSLLLLQVLIRAVQRIVTTAPRRLILPSLFLDPHILCHYSQQQPHSHHLLPPSTSPPLQRTAAAGSVPALEIKLPSSKASAYNNIKHGKCGNISPNAVAAHPDAPPQP